MHLLEWALLYIGSDIIEVMVSFTDAYMYHLTSIITMTS